MHKSSRKWLTPIVCLSVVTITLGGSSIASAKSLAFSSGITAPNNADVNAVLSPWGWTPPAAAATPIACTDDSYAKAVKDGLRYGTYSFPPYFVQGASNTQATGIEWQMLTTAATYAGITKVTYTVAPYDSLIPAITSGRLDLMPAHETPARLAAIGFTAPVYWYGPVIAVPRGNPGKIKGFSDLTRAGIKVAVIKGSAAQIYMDKIKGKITAFPDQTTELAALQAGRVSAALEDSITLASYVKVKPKSGIIILKGKSLDPKTLYDLGYGYFEFGLPKDACSLNLALSTAISQMRAQGVYLQILKKAGLQGLATVSIPGTEG
jgi:polar amino acid transport system substrate-binding protein